MQCFYCRCCCCAFGKPDLVIVIDTDAHYAGSGCIACPVQPISCRKRQLPIGRHFTGHQQQHIQRVDEKRTSSFVAICLGLGQRLCACLRTFALRFLLHHTPLHYSRAQKYATVLANGAALIFSHRSPFDGHAGVIYGTDYSQTRTRIQLWLFGFLVGAHLKMTIINCMYYLRPLAPIGCQLALAERAASAAIPCLSVWALRAPYSQSYKWAYWLLSLLYLETQHFECVTCICFGYCITKSQAFLPKAHKSFAQFGNYC